MGITDGRDVERLNAIARFRRHWAHFIIPIENCGKRTATGCGTSAAATVPYRAFRDQFTGLGYSGARRLVLQTQAAFLCLGVLAARVGIRHLGIFEPVMMFRRQIGPRLWRSPAAARGIASTLFNCWSGLNMRPRCGWSFGHSRGPVNIACSSNCSPASVA
jgi:hypothetical protein